MPPHEWSFVISFTLIIPAALSAKQCYFCSSTTRPECVNLDENLSNLCAATTHQEINCVKYIYRHGALNVTYRGCKRQNVSCEDLKKGEKRTIVACHLCETDMCNGVHTFKHFSVLIVLLELVAFCLVDFEI